MEATTEKRPAAAPTSTRIRRAGSGDLDALAHMLAAAFFDDPIQQWLFPNERRRMRRLVDAFHREARWFVDLGTTWAADDLRGASLWSPPHVTRIPLAAQLRMAVAYRSLIGPRLRSATSFLAGMERHRPREAHWYLAILGTDPAAQGRGIGAAVIDPVLQRCDDAGIGAYLESSKEANVPWYQRHGFEVTKVLEHRDGPPLWLMWRDPR
jgi:GNAT superfamily N-acetyltransferase